LHEYDRALALYQNVLASCPDSQCPAHVLAETLYELGLAYEAKGEPARAIEPLRRAVAIRSSTEGGVVQRAEASFVLGRVLWTSGEEREAGRATVVEALAVFSAHPESAEDAPAATAWLAQHPH
jgi:tetratricopeptide (TPR) repeat protein